MQKQKEVSNLNNIKVFKVAKYYKKFLHSTTTDNTNNTKRQKTKKSTISFSTACLHVLEGENRFNFFLSKLLLSLYLNLITTEQLVTSFNQKYKPRK